MVATDFFYQLNLHTVKEASTSLYEPWISKSIRTLSSSRKKETSFMIKNEATTFGPNSRTTLVEQSLDGMGIQ
jgi:hypothetical protein